MNTLWLVAIIFLAQLVQAETISCYRSMEGGKANEWSWKNCATKTIDGEFKLKPAFKKKLIFRKNGLANMCFSDGQDGGCYWFNKNLKGVRALSLEYSADEFSQGMARHLNRQNKFGYFNEKLEIVIPAEYDVAMPFSKDNTAVVCKGCVIPHPKEDQNELKWSSLKGQWSIIDKSGKVVKSCGDSICTDDSTKN